MRTTTALQALAIFSTLTTQIQAVEPSTSDALISVTSAIPSSQASDVSGIRQTAFSSGFISEIPRPRPQNVTSSVTGGSTAAGQAGSTTMSGKSLITSAGVASTASSGTTSMTMSGTSTGSGSETASSTSSTSTPGAPGNAGQTGVSPGDTGIATVSSGSGAMPTGALEKLGVGLGAGVLLAALL